jgi:acetolactate synthase small subunit
MNEASTYPNALLNGKAIFAGIISALAITAILNILGMSLGLTALGYQVNAPYSLGITGYLWLLVTSAIATFAGGWIAASAGEKNIETTINAIVNGLTVWAGTALITLFLAVSSTGLLISGASAVLKNAVTVGGIQPMMTVTAEIDNQTFNQIKSTLNNQLKQNKVKPESMDDIIADTKSLLLSSSEQQKQKLHNNLVEVIQSHSDMDKNDIQSMIKQWEDKYNELYQIAKENTKQTAATAGKGAAGGLFAIFLINFITLVTAIYGAKFAVNKHTGLQLS